MRIDKQHKANNQLDLDSLACPSTMHACNQGDLILSYLGMQDYQQTLQAMQHYTKLRSSHSPNQIWLLEHHPIYTRGLLSKQSDILATLPFPIVDTDRGGQITFHGPGQIIGYLMINLESQEKIGSFVSCIENILVRVLQSLGIKSYGDPHRRGVYVGQKKIASIGLRVKKENTYHGFSLNVDMDMQPFQYINPCGNQQETTQIRDYTDTPLCQVYHRCIIELIKTWGQRQSVAINTSPNALNSLINKPDIEKNIGFSLK